MNEKIIITDEEKLLSALGLCIRARAAIVGVPLICTAMKGGAQNKVLLVLEASDSSENTHKRISDRCAFYGVRIVRLGRDSMALADRNVGI